MTIELQKIMGSHYDICNQNVSYIGDIKLKSINLLQWNHEFNNNHNLPLANKKVIQEIFWTNMELSSSEIL